MITSCFGLYGINTQIVSTGWVRNIQHRPCRSAVHMKHFDQANSETVCAAKNPVEQITDDDD